MEIRILNKVQQKYWFTLVSLIVILSIAQSFIPSVGDDPFFTDQLFSIGWLIGRYQQWSSRIFIEAILILVSKQMWLFRLINAIVFVLLIDSLVKVTLGRRIESLLLIAIILLFLPVTLFLSAGWLATSVNYLWPITVGTLIITGLDKKLTIKRGIGISLLTLFATNQEQVCASLLLFLVGKISVAIFKKKKIHIQSYLVLGFTLINFVIIVLSPGNQSRNTQSIPALFPEFAQFSMLDKINLGISNTSKVLLVQQNFLMILFLSMLAVGIILTGKLWYMKLLAAVPLVVIPINILITTLTNNGYTSQSFSDYLLTKQSSSSLNSLMELVIQLLTDDVSPIWNIIFVVIFICILVSLVYISKNLSLAYIFMIGLASHTMMGFSPSIFKSGDRTAFILYIT